MDNFGLHFASDTPLLTTSSIFSGHGLNLIISVSVENVSILFPELMNFLILTTSEETSNIWSIITSIFFKLKIIKQIIKLNIYILTLFSTLTIFLVVKRCSLKMDNCFFVFVLLKSKKMFKQVHGRVTNTNKALSFSMLLSNVSQTLYCIEYFKKVSERHTTLLTFF